MIPSFPILNPLAKTILTSYLSEILAAPFVDRQHNVTLPSLITELLRIAAEMEHE